MAGWSWLRERLRVLFRKRGAEQELDDEISFHLDMETRSHIATGLTPEEARRRALLEFGGVERFKEQVRDVRGARVLDDWLLDSRIALRSFLRRPAFLVSVMTALGLGIGGNVAMLGIFESTLLAPLPYADPDGLVMGRVTYEGRLGNTVSAPDYFDYRDEADNLAGLAAYTPFELTATLTGVGDAERVVAPLASTNLFSTLGVEPALGRSFTGPEGEPGADPVVLLTDGFWRTRFGGDPGAVGSTVVIDGTAATIVGVLPADFYFPVRADVWRPMIRGGAFAGARQFHNWVLVGRLAEGRGLVAAQQEVDVISARLAELYPDSNRDKGLNLTPLAEALAARDRPTVLILSVAMMVLLLIACANVGGLLLARSSARRTELSVRASLGAARGRLLRQFLAEGAVLVLAAAAVGAALAAGIQRSMLGLVPIERVEPGLSWSAVGIATCVAMSAVALFVSMPVLRGGVLAGSLRTRTGGSRSTARFRSTLVVAQVMLTTVLLTMSGLLVRSLSQLHAVETGFDADGLLVAGLQLPQGAYSDVSARRLFYEELGRRLEARPDVERAGMVDRLPVRDGGGDVRVAPPEEFGLSGVFGSIAFQRIVLPGYFDAMGIPIVAGRDVSREDTRDAPNAILLSRSLAEDLFPGADAVGRSVGVDIGGSEPWVAEVVGVVGDVVTAGLAAGPRQTMYFAYAQRSPAAMRLALRTRGDASALAAAVRDEARRLDPDVPVSDMAWMEDILESSTADRRSVMLLLGSFAVLALVLAAVGLYGVLAYQVAQRTHEIGVRMALGSSVGGVVRSVLSSGYRLVGVGIVLGLPAAWGASRLMEGLLFGVRATDPPTYLAAAAFLAAVAAVACAMPSRRAASVDPAVAFREGVL